MREIKFKAWHNYENKMYEVQSIDFFWGLVTLQWWTKNEDGSETHNTKDVQFYGEVDNANTDKTKAFNEVFGIELMQYTGLKDKNGLEIYEGDVVKLSDQVKEIIIWNETDAAFQVKLIGKLADVYSNKYLGDWVSCYEVIGNIYENPELLQEV